MCDCYWPKCSRCSERVPLHIADFCMDRRDVAVFCHRHVPRRDVIVYELVTEAYHPAIRGGPGFYADKPKGWRMGIRYRRRPPRDHGLQAAEPNVGSEYLAEHRTRTGGRRYFTSRSQAAHRSERAAIAASLRDLRQQREAPRASDEPAFKAWTEAQERVWLALRTRQELRARLGELVAELPLLQQLRDSGNLVALVLIGSLSQSDFIPELSDVDLWVLGRRLKPGLVTESAELAGQHLEVNLVCRNLRALARLVRQRTPVDLVALRYGEVLEDRRGVMSAWRRRADRYRASSATRDAWMTSASRWLSRAIEQYLSSDCAHCFFGALYHAARDLLRAHLVGHGEDLTEGWEVEAAVARRWPELARCYGRIRYARAHWQALEFPLFEKRSELTGELGALVVALERVAREVYRGYGLCLPRFAEVLQTLVQEQDAKRFFLFRVDPETRRLSVGYENGESKLLFRDRRLVRVRRVAGSR